MWPGSSPIKGESDGENKQKSAKQNGPRRGGRESRRRDATQTNCRYIGVGLDGREGGP